MDTNTTTQIGRLTSDPEIRNVGDKSVCQFSIAVGGMKEGDVSFFQVESWGKTGEAVSKYSHKGDRVCVTGRLKQQRWADSSGANRSIVKIVADHVQFLTAKNNQDKPETYPEHVSEDIPF